MSELTPMSENELGTPLLALEPRVVEGGETITVTWEVPAWFPRTTIRLVVFEERSQLSLLGGAA